MLPEREFRAFGSFCSDIELDFIKSRKIQISLALLQSCSREPELFQRVLNGTGSERILNLWRLVWASVSGESVVEVHVQCQETSCREPLGFQFSEEELVEITQQKSPAVMSVRVPTSQDSLNLLHQDPKIWLNELVGEVSIEEASELWQQLDPLIALNCETLCPSCHLNQSFSLDLESLALKRLQDLQTELIHTVHQLAERYHWSEEQILSLPVWRRQRYLQLLKREDRWT